MFASKARAYPSEEPFGCSTLGQAPSDIQHNDTQHDDTLPNNLKK